MRITPVGLPKRYCSCITCKFLKWYCFLFETCFTLENQVYVRTSGSYHLYFSRVGDWNRTVNFIPPPSPYKKKQRVNKLKTQKETNKGTKVSLFVPMGPGQIISLGANVPISCLSPLSTVRAWFILI